MGQGNYTMIVFGCFEPQDFDDPSGEKSDAIKYGPGFERTGIRGAYEAEPCWLGVPIVEDGSSYGVAPADWSRTARPLRTLIEWVETEHAETLAKARETWARAREAHPWLPEGELLFVADYD